MMIRPLHFTALLCWLMLAIPTHAQEPGCPSADRTTAALILGVPELAGILSVETAMCSGLQLDADRIGFRLNNTTLPVHGGIRSEIAVDYPFQEGESVRYSWEMMLSGPFPGDTPLNRWWSLAQWHDQPDRRIGEKWKDFPPRSPPVSIYFEERNGKPGIGVITNGRDKRSWTPVPRGEWLRLSVSMLWSRGDEGKLIFEIDGHPEAQLVANGKNMYNGYQHYLKFGQYRHPQIKTDNTVFFRNLSIAKEPLRASDAASTRRDESTPLHSRSVSTRKAA